MNYNDCMSITNAIKTLGFDLYNKDCIIEAKDSQIERLQEECKALSAEIEGLREECAKLQREIELQRLAYASCACDCENDCEIGSESEFEPKELI